MNISKPKRKTIEEQKNLIITALSLALLRSCIFNSVAAYRFWKGGLKDAKKLSEDQRKVVVGDFFKSLTELS